MISCVGDGGTYALDITGGNSGNGANVEIYRYTAIEVENQIDNWTMDYLTNGKGGKKWD